MADDPPILTPAQNGPILMQIADRVIGRPLMMHPTKVEVILQVLQGRLPIDGAALAPLSPDASRFAGSWGDGKGSRAWFRSDGGVAIVDVMGSLVNRGAWIGASSGMTSYEGLAKQVDAIKADAESGKTKAAIFDMNSPGGEATGMFAFAMKVRELAAVIPVVAVVNDMACSACYGIASQCTEIVVSTTSMVGSIGVVLTHLDRSGEMEKRGVSATLIYAGAHKVDGHPFGGLSDAVRADLQAEVGKFYDQFVGLVAQGRGDRLTEVNARATEARTFLGQEAIDRGLADRMASFDAVLASLQSKPPRAGKNQKGTRSMSGENTITTEAHTAAVAAARAEGHAAGLTEGKALGATDATTRIGAILNCDEAKGREPLAAHIAFKTSMSADDAKGMLAASPVGGAPTQPVPPQQSIEQRQREAGDFGPGAGAVKPGTADRSASMWKKAVETANGGIHAS